MKTFTTEDIEIATAHVITQHEPTVELLKNEPVMMLVFATFMAEIIHCLEDGDYND